MRQTIPAILLALLPACASDPPDRHGFEGTEQIVLDDLAADVSEEDPASNPVRLPQDTPGGGAGGGASAAGPEPVCTFDYGAPVQCPTFCAQYDWDGTPVQVCGIYLCEPTTGGQPVDWMCEPGYCEFKANFRLDYCEYSEE